MQACSEEDWLRLRDLRLKEARERLDSAPPDVVYDHVRVAAEFCMKAAIARKKKFNEWPDNLRTHDLKALSERGDLAREISDICRQKPRFRTYWFMLRGTTDRRYALSRMPRSYVRELLNALEDKDEGLVKCMSDL